MKQGIKVTLFAFSSFYCISIVSTTLCLQKKHPWHFRP